jgi:hypothetical protein
MEQVMGDVFNSDLAESVARRFALGKGGVDVRDAVTPGVLWGNAEWEGGFQLGLGLQVAAHALGYPTGSPFDSAGSCRTEGQAKAVVAIWLAAQATAGSGAALRAANATDPWGVTFERSHSGGGSSSVGYSYHGPDSFTLQSLVYSATGGA